MQITRYYSKNALNSSVHSSFCMCIGNLYYPCIRLSHTHAHAFNAWNQTQRPSANTYLCFWLHFLTYMYASLPRKSMCCKHDAGNRLHSGSALVLADILRLFFLHDVNSISALMREHSKAQAAAIAAAEAAALEDGSSTGSPALSRSSSGAAAAEAAAAEAVATQSFQKRQHALLAGVTALPARKVVLTGNPLGMGGARCCSCKPSCLLGTVANMKSRESVLQQCCGQPVQEKIVDLFHSLRINLQTPSCLWQLCRSTSGTGPKIRSLECFSGTSHSHRVVAPSMLRNWYNYDSALIQSLLFGYTARCPLLPLT